MPASVVDLFCGIGGLTKGLELAGLNVIAGIDLDESCRYAYEANSHSQFIAGDVNTINSDSLISLYPSNDFEF